MNLPDPGELCLNCGAPLGGQYCGQCGQRATSRFISLWQLTSDAFGDLFELDSRLWRTLIPLMIRPGRLTRDYLEGRRARYMPPFRMYLVLSLVFFLVAFFNPQSDFEIFFEDTGETSAEDARTEAIDDAESVRQETREQARLALEKLVEQGVVEKSVLQDSGLAEPPRATEETSAPAGADLPDAVEETPGRDGFNVRIDDGANIDCKNREFETDGFPEWLQRRLTPERLDRLCERWEVAGEDGLARAMLDRVPAGLILLLPLMALVLKLLYVFSGRYYVEHLLFFVHFHAFLFLLLTLEILWARLVRLLGLNEAVSVLVIVASALYVPVYLFRAMRHVYGQGRFITFLKFLVLTFAYALGFTFMLLGTLLLAAISL